MQFSVAVSNAMLDSIETLIGASAILKIRTGAKPVDCAAADAGTVLATVALPADWMAAAAARVKAKSGTWEDIAADATGIAAHYRLYASDGVTCHGQGTVGASGSGADMEVSNTSFALGQDVLITAYSWADNNG